MHIEDAKGMDKILENYTSGIADTDFCESTFKMHRNFMQSLLDNTNATPAIEDIDGAIEYIEESTSVTLTRDQLKGILDLFPSRKIALALYGIGDTGARDGIYDAVCTFFCGCKSPTPSDGVDIDRLMKHLAYQAREMGYSVTGGAANDE